jgi:5-methyltetrahydropteroyltriglutamate--homocysteine methyltransferase
MTSYKLSLTGVHARNEATIQATQDWERGRIDSKRLNAAFKEDVASLVSLQKQAGADYISDGQISVAWQDFLTPFTSGFAGVKKGPMLRWYNTNTFYQAPVVHGEISSSGQVLWRRVDRRAVRAGAFRIALPDPLTFSELAEDAYYHDAEDLQFAYAEALNAELRTLEKNGVDYFQFSSPALVARFRGKPITRDKLGQLGEAIRTSLRGTKARTGFHTFFGDASPYLPEIFDLLPADDIGFDFTQTDPEALSETGKGIIAGVADARSTYLESVGELKEKVELIASRTGTRSITLAPSCDLRYIPRVAADDKLRQLGALKAVLGGRTR